MSVWWKNSLGVKGVFKVARLRCSGKIAFWCAFDRTEFILTKHLVQKVVNARHLRGCLEREGVDYVYQLPAVRHLQVVVLSGSWSAMRSTPPFSGRRWKTSSRQSSLWVSANTLSTWLLVGFPLSPYYCPLYILDFNKKIKEAFGDYWSNLYSWIYCKVFSFQLASCY